MHILQSAFLIMALSWLGLSLLFYLLQASYIFYPEKELLASPADINLKYEEVSLKPTRLETIMGWYIPHSNPRASLIFFMETEAIFLIVWKKFVSLMNWG